MCYSASVKYEGSLLNANLQSNGICTTAHLSRAITFDTVKSRQALNTSYLTFEFKHVLRVAHFTFILRAQRIMEEAKSQVDHGQTLSNDDDNLLYNLSLNSNTTDVGYFVIPTWRISLWSSFFGLMVLTSFFGNGVVVWIVAADKKMRTVTNCFLVTTLKT